MSQTPKQLKQKANLMAALRRGFANVRDQQQASEDQHYTAIREKLMRTAKLERDRKEREYATRRERFSRSED